MDLVAGAALLPKFGGYIVEGTNGDVFAIADDRGEAETYRQQAQDWLTEAAMCGHADASAWARARRPVTIRIATDEDVEEAREEGTPLLQREP